MKRDLPKFIIRRKDSPYLWYKFKVNGVLHRGSTETADVKTAEMFAAKQRGDAVQGKTQAKQSTITLVALAKRYLESCRKQPSYTSKEDCLNAVLACPRFEGKLAKAITREDCRFYQVWRTDTVMKSSCNRELGTFRNMYNVAIKDMQLVLPNPVAGLKFFSEKPFRRTRFMSREEKAIFFSDVETPQRTKDVVMFDIKQGLRQGEIRDLKIDDLDFRNQSIRVLAGEEDSTRFVPMFPVVVDILKRWVASAKALGTKYVFHNEDGTQLSRHGWITTSFEWACKRGKFENLHFHDLRHTFASDFIMAGGDFKTLGLYLGHSTKTMIDRYAHVAPTYKAAQILLLPTEKAFETVTGPAEVGHAGVTLHKVKGA